MKGALLRTRQVLGYKAGRSNAPQQEGRKATALADTPPGHKHKNKNREMKPMSQALGQGL